MNKEQTLTFRVSEVEIKYIEEIKDYFNDLFGMNMTTTQAITTAIVNFRNEIKLYKNKSNKMDT